MSRKFEKFLSLAEKNAQRYALAISGGSDSIALAYLIKNSRIFERCVALVVDHGLRAESTVEAQKVRECLSKLGYSTKVLTIRWVDTANCTDSKKVGLSFGGSQEKVLCSDFASSISVPRPKSTSRIEEAARKWRYRLLGEYCVDNRITGLITGHHAGDQVETFIMRLARQSGINGLAGMSVFSEFPFRFTPETKNIQLIRPLLGFKKEELTKICRGNQLQWFEDPTNKDTLFQRNMVRRVISDAEVQKHSQSSKLKMFENDTVLDLIGRIKSHVRYSSNLVQRTLERIEEFDEVSCTSSWNLRNLSCASFSENTHVEHDLILHNDHLLNNCIISTARRVVRTEHPLNLEHVLKFRAQIKRFIESETASDNQPVYKNDAYKVDAKKNRRGFSAVCAGGLVLLPPTAKNNQSFTFIRQPHTREELRKLVISQNEFGNTVLWDDRFFLRLEVNDPTGYDGWTVTPLELAATSEMFVPLNSQQIAEHNLDKHRDHLLCIGVQHFAVSLKTFARNSPVFLKTNKKRYLRDLPVISVGAYNEPGRTLNLCVAIPALNLFFLDSNFVFYQSLK